MDVVSVIGLKVHVTNYKQALSKSIDLSELDKPSAVSAANTHLATEARIDYNFSDVMDRFDLVLPDGVPLKWVINYYQKSNKREKLVDRVYGPYFMKYAIQNIPSQKSHFLFGGSEECLKDLKDELYKINPKVNIVGVLSPPFREWSAADQRYFADQINNVNPDFIWVALGGVKQENWIINNMKFYNRGVFFAVGDAFELLAKRRPFAPQILQKYGMTWFYRLYQEPSRMWKRYLKSNTLFIYFFFKDLFKKNNT